MVQEVNFRTVIASLGQVFSAFARLPAPVFKNEEYALKMERGGGHE
jgi:hypothetical protein